MKSKAEGTLRYSTTTSITVTLVLLTTLQFIKISVTPQQIITGKEEKLCFSVIYECGPRKKEETETCGSTGEADDSHVLRMWRLVGRVEETSLSSATAAA